MSRFSEILKGFYGFSKTNYKFYFFTILFFSLLIAQLYFNSVSTDLTQFKGRMMGEATINGIDVGKRVSSFYISGIIFLFSSLVLYFLFYLLFHKKSDLKWMQLPNSLSVAGSVLVFLNGMGYVAGTSVYLVLGLVFCSLLFVLVKKKYISETNAKLFDQTVFAYLISIGFSFFFLVKELVSCNLSLVFFMPLSFILLLTALVVFWRRKKSDYLLNSSQKSASILFPLSFLPLCSVLKIEIYMILGGKGIMVSSSLIYFILLLLISAWMAWIALRKSGHFLSVSEMLSKRYLPFMIIGISALAYYEPFYSNTSTELFEKANRFLPVMEFYKYNVIPMFEKFNSHMLSDFVTIYLYSLFNKLEGMSPLIYDFIFPTLGMLITFVVIRDLSRRYFVALFVVLLFPFSGQLIPLNFSMALIGVYILKKFISGRQDLKAHLWLFSGLIFLMIWRIDIGVGALLGFGLVLLVYGVFGKIRFSLKNALISLGLFALVFSVAGILLSFKGVNILTTAKDYLSHISASQSYGFSALSTEINSRDVLLFNLHHYVFPIIVVSSIIYIIFNFKRFAASRNTRFAVLCILFCVGFYLGNFQRGLVRHGFVEHTDLYLSSFLFLIIGALMYLFFQKRSSNLKFILFISLAFVFITSFKYEQFEPRDLLGILGTKKNSDVQLHPGGTRELNPELMAEKYLPFKTFVDQELEEDETFIDFSNTPMFYYFTGKETPSFFYQNPICMHNDHLQERFLDKLKNYKVPIILFSRSHMNDEQWGWDFMDFVPNTLRHYRIAEYFYQNYEPFTIVKDHCVWRTKGKTFAKPDSLYSADNYSNRFQYWEIGMIPYLWATYDHKIMKAEVQAIISNERTLLNDELEFAIPKNLDRSQGNYIYIVLSATNREDMNVRLAYGPGNGEIGFTLPAGAGTRTFAVRISAQYNWYAKENSKLVLSLKGEGNVYLEKISILRGN